MQPPTVESPFSILIPSWNNLPYLKLCIESIIRNSALPHEIIVFANEGSDGTLDWLKEQGIRYLHSEANEGICIPMNRTCALSSNDLIVYMNDDMYACPGWDIELYKALAEVDSPYFMLSSTMIEPSGGSNPCVVLADFGDTPESFQESDLLKSLNSLQRKDWQGSTWPPCVMTRTAWNEVGGFSEEFSPGAYSDPDLSMKLWKSGARVFRGVGTSLVYHFGSKSTKRIELNDGRTQFLRKWGILPSLFTKHYLRRGADYDGPLSNPENSPRFLLGRLKSFLHSRLLP